MSEQQPAVTGNEVSIYQRNVRFCPQCNNRTLFQFILAIGTERRLIDVCIYCYSQDDPKPIPERKGQIAE